MKKILLIILCSAIASPAFANVIKYRISDGEPIAMGAFKNLKEDEGTRVVVVDFDVPKEPLENYTFNGAELIRKPQTEIDQKLESKKQKRKGVIDKLKQKTGLTDEDLAEIGIKPLERSRANGL